ncbi:hypothetical protein BCR33DRAFT_844868 [Rhizoclosmatium globosum]|uniref:BZIP domain-containing protein n=1 Tax=Rhizoclosmatium globosum TaxID=329046 RepID=A0A1Y2D2N6_9FUNG|nr:hypothetical protein BCR33DRAFT_844868 [Rhizoclosmatium globosum]|eukprot:ORY53563.1 hypothetical protein BCR33DRAFT_844868 [Rhizoclosmatium globosum]
MDADSESTASATNPDRQYNPNSGRGRRRTSAEPASKRAGQLRDAQRALRERKLAYISGLENEVASLKNEVKDVQSLRERIRQLEFEALLSSSTSASTSQSPAPAPAIAPSPCLNCSAESFKSSMYFVQIQTLQAQMVQLKAELDLWKSEAIRYRAPLALITASPHFRHVHGPIEVETTRILMKSIPSLKNSKNVDVVLQHISDRVREREMLKPKEWLARCMRAFTDMFDECTVMDRLKVIEAMAVFYERNKNHFGFLYDLWDRFVAIEPTNLKPINLDLSKPNHQRMQQLNSPSSILPPEVPKL